jgi:hypothetical protein
MNNYLETIDNAINAVHSKAWSDRPDSSEKYDANLLALIELRSFIEFAFDVEEEK